MASLSSVAPMPPSIGESKGETKTIKRHAMRRINSQYVNHDEYNQDSDLDVLRHRVWITCEEPRSSQVAQYLSAVMTFFIVLSIFVFCIRDMKELDPKDGDWPVDPSVWNVFDNVFNVIFTLEFFVRMGTSPNTAKFIKDPLNVVDFFAIIPFYIERTVPIDNVNTLKVFRVLRVLKMLRRFDGSKILFRAIRYSAAALTVPMFFLFQMVIMFAACLYFVELGKPSESGIKTVDGVTPHEFDSIFHAMYFILVTMTTVGYGDQTPKTVMGRAITILAMLFGIFFMSMPLAIIGNYFEKAWAEVEAEQRQVSMRHRSRKLRKKLSMVMHDGKIGGTKDEVVADNAANQQDYEKLVLDWQYRDTLELYFELGIRINACDAHLRTMCDQVEKRNELHLDSFKYVARTCFSHMKHICRSIEQLAIQCAELTGSDIVNTHCNKRVKDRTIKSGKHKSAWKRAKTMSVNLKKLDFQPGTAGSALKAEFNEKEIEMILMDPEHMPLHAKVFLFLSVPASSAGAKTFSNIMGVIINASVITFCCQTLPRFETPFYQSGFALVDTAWLIIFGTEITVRTIVAQHQRKYWSDIMTWVDIISLIPFAVGIPLSAAGIDTPRYLRLLGMVRVFKNLRHFKAVGVIKRAFLESFAKLTVPFFFLTIFILVFAAVLRVAEGGQEVKTYMDIEGVQTISVYEGSYAISEFNDIFRCAWVTIVTMTSVGYGDYSPQTLPGRIVCSLAMLFGTFYMAMPLSIVGSKFFHIYEDEQRKTALVQNFFDDSAPEDLASDGPSEKDRMFLDAKRLRLDPEQQDELNRYAESATQAHIAMKKLRAVVQLVEKLLIERASQENKAGESNSIPEEVKTLLEEAKNAADATKEIHVTAGTIFMTSFLHSIAGIQEKEPQPLFGNKRSQFISAGQYNRHRDDDNPKDIKDCHKTVSGMLKARSSPSDAEARSMKDWD